MYKLVVILVQETFARVCAVLPEPKVRVILTHEHVHVRKEQLLVRESAV